MTASKMKKHNSTISLKTMKLSKDMQERSTTSSQHLNIDRLNDLDCKEEDPATTITLRFDETYKMEDDKKDLKTNFRNDVDQANLQKWESNFSHTCYQGLECNSIGQFSLTNPSSSSKSSHGRTCMVSREF